MTAIDTVTTRALAARSAERRATRSAAWNVVGGNAVAALWYWPIVVVITIAIAVVQRRLDAIEGSVFLGVGLSVNGFLFVMGIIMTSALIAVHVAAGGTRRAFARGTGVAAIVTAVGSALLLTAGLVVERLIFRAQGWSWEQDILRLYDEHGFVMGALVMALLCATYLLVGSGVAMGYYRWGGWRGTAALPAVIWPILLCEVSLGSGYLGSPLASALGWAPMHNLLAILGGLLAIAAAFAILQALTRTIAIRPVT